MPTLYVANLTRQVREFLYKLPEQGLRRQMIPIGQQIRVAGIENTEQIRVVLEHYYRYGMKSVEDAMKSKTFTGLCYSIDKPVKIDQMEIGIAANDAVLVQRGQQVRKEAAIAAAHLADQQVDGRLKNTETTITEERKDGGEPQVQEGVLIDKSGPAAEQSASGQNAKAKVKEAAKKGGR